MPLHDELERIVRARHASDVDLEAALAAVRHLLRDAEQASSREFRLVRAIGASGGE